MINLLPYKEKDRIEQLHRLRMGKTIFGGSALLIGIAGVLLVPTLLTINSRFAIANNQVATLERDGTIVSSVDIASLQARVQAVGRKLAVPPAASPVDRIAVVEESAPNALALNRFVTTPTGLSVYGTAKTRADLQRFIATLEADQRISAVESPVSNFVKSVDSPFMIGITFK